jgi:hypothetical protein
LALVAALALPACDGCSDDDLPAEDGGGVGGSGAASSTASSSAASSGVSASSSASGGSGGAGGRGGAGGDATGGDGGAGGNAPACTIDAPAWAARFGDVGSEELGGIAAADDGVVVTGSFDGTIDFGDGPLTALDGNDDIFVAKLDASGAALWSKRFGGTSSDRSLAVTVAPDGRIAVGGSFSGTVDFGAGPVMSNFIDDAFVLVLDAAGEPLWSVTFGGTSFDETTALAFDASGVLTAAGQFRDTVTLPTGTLTGAGDDDIFLIHLQNGVILDAQAYGGTAHDVPFSLSAAPGGGVTMTGWIDGAPIDLGGGALTPQGTDGFLARYDADGAHVSSFLFGDAATDRGASVRHAPSGELVLAGLFMGTLDVGTGSMVAGASLQGFVAGYSATGAPIWSTHPDGAYSGGFVAATPAGDGWAAAGSFVGVMDVAGTPMASDGVDAVVLRLDTAGDVVWGGCFGGAGVDQTRAMTATGDGTVWLFGLFEGTADVGGTQLVSAGDDDLFLVKVAP